MFSTRASRLAVSLFGLALALPQPASAQQEPTRVAVVNVESVVARSTVGLALQARLQEFTNQANVEGQAILDELNALRDSLVASLSDSIPQEEVDRLQETFTARSSELDTFQQTMQTQGDSIRLTGFQEIEVALQPVLINVRDELGYDLILNSSAGMVLIARPQVDITEVVLLRFNQATGAPPGGLE